ncbi:hypothetical protein IMCC9480_407 [Oxalobacteraceae bacterium IMCC9480]|nr:hypothetical protein IMCC9480_407 [Oxalobacteraceae bacterium IMCC9480]
MVTNGVAAAPEDAANFVKLDAHTPFGDFVRKTFTEFQTSDSKMSVRQILAGYQLGSFDTTPKELSVVKYYADSTLTDQELNDAFGIKTDASSEKTWASQDSAFLDMSSTQPDEPGDELKRVTEGKYYIKPSDVDAAKFASGDSGFKQFLQQKVNDGVAVDDVLKNYLAGKYRTNRQELGIADYYVNSGLDNDGIVKAFGLTKPVVPAEDVSDHKPGSPDFNEYTCLQTLTSNSLFNDTHETDTLNGRQAQNVNPLLNPFARESGADLNDLYRVAKGDGSADEVAAANWLLTRPGLLDRVMDGGKMSRESFKATLDAGVTKGAEITPNSDPFLKQTDIDKIEENSDAGKNAAKILFDLGPSVNSNGDQRYSYETLISIVNANNSEKLKNAARYVLSHPEMYHALCTDNNTNFDKNALEDYGR